MITGTSYFTSLAAAARYYADYIPHASAEQLRAAIEAKIAHGEISIGVPPTQEGQAVRIIDNGTRYAVETSPATRQT